MQHQTHKAKLSYQDFLLFPEDGKRHELLGGDHLVTPSPSTKHQRVSRNLSKSTQRIDSLVKRKLYERCGMQEYWLVDPEHETVDICRLADGKHVRQTALSREDESILKTPLMPGFQLRLSDIFS